MTPEKWLSEQFERCSGWISAALRKPKQPYGLDHVRSEIMAGNAQLWPGMNACIVTRIDIKPDGTKTIFGWIAGGDRNEINQLTSHASEWGKRQGCTKAQTIQRLGFIRKPLDGFKPVGVVMEKDI